jgi:hypothetical protein
MNLKRLEHFPSLASSLAFSCPPASNRVADESAWIIGLFNSSEPASPRHVRVSRPTMLLEQAATELQKNPGRQARQAQQRRTDKPRATRKCNVIVIHVSAAADLTQRTHSSSSPPMPSAGRFQRSGHSSGAMLCKGRTPERTEREEWNWGHYRLLEMKCPTYPT